MSARSEDDNVALLSSHCQSKNLFIPSSLELSEASITSHKSLHDMLHAASENTLGNSSPVTTFRSGLTATCAFAPDDSDGSVSEVEDEDKCCWSSHLPTSRQNMRQCSSPAVQKVRPGYENDEGGEDEGRIARSRVASFSMNLLSQATERPSTSGVTPSKDQSPFPFFESCKVLAVQDSQNVFELFGHNAQSTDLFLFKNSDEHKRLNHDINQLLSEREQLLQRIAAIEHIIHIQQQQQQNCLT